ncbi:alpha-mannosyltransferase alg11p [Fusarium sporotrichioides]|uniref:Alpha-mannosyltransferase alg11p n=1 Tax=Fusarium sporotrichioides TaxID=5514 RepID=A0A395S679_FUSSP|nr:alpha-mannosyltransferase alg11p [Fusarium sporotrichioides]
MLDVSNARPIAILAGYLTSCAILAALSISTIYRQAVSSKSASRRRYAIIVFSALAALSLATTWYHMFCFFKWSYQQWESTRLEKLDDELHLGEWLRDTKLFKQAWVSTLEQPARAWWSLQIFAFCANWSVMLAWQDTKRRIPHLWIFMLLGQIVAISFAANLSFLAFLVFNDDADTSSKPNIEEKTLSSSTKSHSLLSKSWLAVLAVTVGCAIAIPSNLDHPKFMYLLLAPHVLAFVPLLLNNLIGSRERVVMDEQPSPTIRSSVRALVVAAAIYHLFVSGGDWRDAMSALYEHPAVSSVGWDVICCWISFSAWFFVRFADNYEKKHGEPPFFPRSVEE